MNISIEIEPSEYVPPVRIINRVEIQIFNLTLFQSVAVMVMLFDANSCPIDTKIVQIEQEEYLLWSNNDEWLINLVLMKLGLSKKGAVVEVPVEVPVEDIAVDVTDNIDAML